MIHYDEPIYRPPSEARSLILQATLGCSHNKCAFCVSFQSKKFRVKKREKLFAEIDHVAAQIKAGRFPNVEKIFLADGDAMVLSTNRILEILAQLYKKFSNLKRVTAYARPLNFKTKSVSELRQIHKAGMTMLYLGAESGDDEVLKRIDKGVTSAQMIDLCKKPTEAGIDLSLTVILGLAGPRLSARHAENTAKLLNQIAPKYASALTLMIEPRKPSFQEVYADKTFKVLKPLDILRECRILIDNIYSDNIMFHSNHASNYLPLAGQLQADKKHMLKQIDLVLDNPDLAQLRPDFMRRL